MQKKHSFFYKTNLFIRSLVFTIISLLTILPYSFICVFCWLFLPLKYRYKIIASWLLFILWALKIVCRIDYRIEGLENIPKDRNGIILSKHQSTWETFFLPTLFFQPAIILKRELLWVPFFGWGLATIAPIAINRTKTSSAMEQIIKQGKKCLDMGRWILVFPEGTRIPVGKIGKYKLGGARLAVATGYPVIPVAHDAGRYWARRKFIKNPGTIHVVIGPLIETSQRTPDEVLEQAKNWIEKTIVKMDADTAKHPT